MSLFNRNKKTAKTAAQRLIVTLTQDRTNLSAAKLEMMKTDILKVLAKYVPIDEGDVDVNIQNDENGVPVLTANVPVRNALRTTPLSSSR